MALGQIIPGNRIKAVDLTDEFAAVNSGALTVMDFVAAVGTTTSTSFTATLTGGAGAAKAFVAPTSGKVMVEWSSGVYNSTAAQDAWCGWELREGSIIGSGVAPVAYLASEERSIRNKVASTSNDSQFGAPMLVENLTPGDAYHVRMMFKVSANTGSFTNKRIIIVPVL